MLALRAPISSLALYFNDVVRDVFARSDLPPGQPLEMRNELAVRKTGHIIVCHGAQLICRGGASSVRNP